MTARALHQRGHQPTVLDIAIAPRHASWSAAGLLMHVPPWRQSLIEPLSKQMLAYSWQEYQQFQDELRSIGCEIDLGLDLTGACLDITGHHPQLEAWLKQNPQPAHTNRAHFPAFLKDHLSPKRGWAYLPSLGGQIRPPRLLEGLRTWLRHNGVAIDNQTVVSINPHAQGYEIHGYNEHGSHRSNADTVIVCAGAQSSNLYPDAKAPQVVPVAGHMIRYQLDAADGHKFVLGDSGGRYMVSRGDGVVLAGSNLREQQDFEVKVDDKVVAELHEFAAGLLPVLRDKPIAQVWVGLRPKHTQSEWPFIYSGGGLGAGVTSGGGDSLESSASSSNDASPFSDARNSNSNGNIDSHSNNGSNGNGNNGSHRNNGSNSNDNNASHSNDNINGHSNDNINGHSPSLSYINGASPNHISSAATVQAASMASFRRWTESGEGAETLPDYQSSPSQPYYLHTGHFHSGIAFAPATAQVMVSCLEDSGAGTDFSQETSIALEKNLPSD